MKVSMTIIFRYVAIFICAMQKMASCIQSIIMAASNKLTVVHNGIPDYQVEPEASMSIRNEWGVGRDETLFGVASRLEPVKGLKYLLQTYIEIAHKYSSIRLVLMGDGTVRDGLEAQARTLGVHKLVVFAGMRADVPDCLTALDIFALPSLAEYHSIELLETMRAWLPIVATDVGGNTESVHDGLEGLIVKPADSAGLKSGMDRLMQDSALCSRLDNAARERFVSEFTEYATLVKTARWLQEVCVK
jgi:glycosyltransferase involved in cell wall biosynthesis